MLASNHRDATGAFSDVLALQGQAKPARWNVKSHDLSQLHQFLDSIHSAGEELADTLAELITTLGQLPPGECRPPRAVRRFGLRAGDAHRRGYLKHIAGAFEEFGKTIRENIDAANVASDLGTADVFAKASGATDKRRICSTAV